MANRDVVPGFLLLEDGTLFRGALRASHATTVAEVVFTTNMSGYQEVFTDPSYRAQIVVMTAPMIGNYGVNPADPESGAPQIAGVVVRELSRTYSNWRAEGDLESYLKAAQIPILEGVDTRKLTRHLRTAGVMRGVIGAGEEPTAEATAALEACPSMEGLDLASRVTTTERYEWGNPQAPYHIVAYDFGIKRNILRLFDDAGCHVTVVPASTPPEAVLELEPDGVFLSNGPGDPDAIEYAPATIKAIAEKQVPMFGICLGHQLLGLTFGAETVKMPYGHRGGNHPVRELETGRILITSQNHGFAVLGPDGAKTIDGDQPVRWETDFGAAELTHLNLYDRTVEGLRLCDVTGATVQYHPEAGPGPHDALHLFDRFVTAIREAA